MRLGDPFHANQVEKIRRSYRWGFGRIGEVRKASKLQSFPGDLLTSSLTVEKLTLRFWRKNSGRSPLRGRICRLPRAYARSHGQLGSRWAGNHWTASLLS